MTTLSDLPTEIILNVVKFLHVPDDEMPVIGQTAALTRVLPYTEEETVDEAIEYNPIKALRELVYSRYIS